MPFSHSVWRPLPQFNSHSLDCAMHKVFMKIHLVFCRSPRQRVNHTTQLIYDRLKNNMQWTPNSNPSEWVKIKIVPIVFFPISSFFFLILQSATNHSILLFINIIINEWWRTKLYVLWVCRPIDIQKLNCFQLNRQFYFHNI